MYNIYNNDNDLFFVCSMIDYVGRKTLNKRNDVVNKIGKEALLNLYEYADVYHCDNPDKVCGELIDDFNIGKGDFDNIGKAQYSLPTYWDIGKVYMRLILNSLETSKRTDDIRQRRVKVIDKLFEVYNSFICEFIDDYNDTTYFESPSYQYECYKAGRIL